MGVDVSLLYGMHIVEGLLPDAHGTLCIDPVTGKRRNVHDVENADGVEQQWACESSVDVARFWGFTYQDFLDNLTTMLRENNSRPDDDGAWYHYVWSISWSLWDPDECRVIAERLAQYADMAAQWQVKLDAEEENEETMRSDNRTWYDSYLLMQQLFARAADEGAWLYTI